jgi:hypothetical protein
MQLFHTTGKTWYKVLYQHTMYVINLSNISIKTNFKQITIKINKFVQYSNEDYNFYMTSRYVLPFIYQSRVTVQDHFQCHCIIVRQYAFLEKFWQYRCRKYWNYVLEMKIWHLNSRFVYVAYIDMFSPTVQWYDIMTKKFARKDLVQHRTILLSPCGDTTSCIRQATFFNFVGKHTQC